MVAQGKWDCLRENCFGDPVALSPLYFQFFPSVPYPGPVNLPFIAILILNDTLHWILSLEVDTDQCWFFFLIGKLVIINTIDKTMSQFSSLHFRNMISFNPHKDPKELIQLSCTVMH